ncbi:hypothetical protein PHLGIDRAFT_328195 [Phlebiopsis gigantea 11061_1 CR5-6]|uniref:Methyltransferase domain-containing protein n=1 Tax=Phlebiopsis gigantea (strain 11061_1 CR5-6) TaxID=745531 RepID=A0A0C3P2V8_PHLG1|nr:hypothetical protein PHLGIDRAFT_328195 [Phlebiopsis gigantea 11061_1 CR5-6]
MEETNESASEDRSGSPAPSMYSFNASVDERLILREVYGRTLNSYNEMYFLPADNEEHRRLDLQHQIYTMILGALYPAIPLVRWALRPRRDRRPVILDVGTGSGSWAVDMAKEFPYCEVIGMDLVPPRIAGELPQNCRFEIDDANLGFFHYRGTFDVVHARAIAMGIKDYPALLKDLAQTLRPGGMIILGDGEMQLYDEERRPLSYSEADASWTQRVFFAGYNASKNKGGNIDCPTMNPTWLRSIDSLTDVGWDKVFIPIGPWIYANEREKVLAEMLRSNCLGYISGLEPLLMSEGYLKESVEKMQRGASAELLELKVRLYSRWSFAWAMKRL